MQAPWIPPPPAAGGRAGRAGRPRWPLLVGGPLLVIVVGLVIAFGPMLEWLIEKSAALMGFSLRFGDVERGLFEVKVSNAHFGLMGQTILSGEASSLTFELGFLGVRRVRAERARVVLAGSVSDLVGGLSRWRTEHDKSPSAEVSCAALSLEVRDGAQEAPWLTFAGSASPTEWGGTLVGQRLSMFGMDVGPTTLGWSSGKSAVTLWLGEQRAEQARVRLDLLGGTPSVARVRAHNASLAALADPLGLPAAKGALLDGQMDLQFLKAGGFQGKAAGTLRGVSLASDAWSGLVLGPTTSISAQIGGTPDGLHVGMKPLVVQSGALSMQGGAELSKQGAARQLRGKLDGMVPCSMLAHNVAGAMVGGGAVGSLVGAVAGAVVAGNVSISVGFDVDTRNPRAGLVQPVIGVGCAPRLP